MLVLPALVIGEDVPHVDDALAWSVSPCDAKAVSESPSAESLSADFLFMNSKRVKWMNGFRPNETLVQAEKHHTHAG